MTIRILCIGKLKEKYWTAAVDEYAKRIGGFCTLQIVERKETKLPKNASAAEERQVIRKEGESLLSQIGTGDFVVALDIDGRMTDSVALAKTLASTFASGRSTVDFVIGGSLGLSEAVKKRADLRLSFSRMTFPHQLARVMLLEQVYRAFKITSGETYHK